MYVCMYSAGGTGVTLVPVPTKTARSHSDIKGRRPFDVPASNFIFHVNFLQWDVANPRTTMPFPHNSCTWVLYGRRNLTILHCQ